MILAAGGLAVLGAMAALPSTPSCAQLAGIVSRQPGIKFATSQLVPAVASRAPYCRVDLRYGIRARQNINMVIELPASRADGGRGGVIGAWNGRTESLGGSGCTGNLLQPPAESDAALREGYVVSGNDLGHAGGDCNPGVNANGTYNKPFIEDFMRTGVKQQVLWSKAVTRLYYGAAAQYNYWNGCSTGGRQGYLLAQELGNELDGILANAPAIEWSRFQTAQMWGQLVMRELTGGPIIPAKLEQARLSAIAACDAADGVRDGIINDPRTCRFSAKANICATWSAPSTNCLTAAEATAIDLIWDGPRNARGRKIWFGLDRGSGFGTLNGAVPFEMGPVQFRWDEHSRDFDWRTVRLSGFAQVAEDGARNLGDLTDTVGPLDTFKAHGGKLLTYVGLSDQFIFPRGVIDYYRHMAARYGGGDQPDFGRLQRFYRLFLAPGVDHCGGGAGPAPLEPFKALVKWTEHGVAPDQLSASGGSAAPLTGRTRPLCPYPQTALYNGTGSTEAAGNFHCGGNLETPAVVCADVLTAFKHESRGALDFRGSGVSAAVCRNQQGAGSARGGD